MEIIGNENIQEIYGVFQGIIFLVVSAGVLMLSTVATWAFISLHEVYTIYTSSYPPLLESCTGFVGLCVCVCVR